MAADIRDGLFLLDWRLRWHRGGGPMVPQSQSEYISVHIAVRQTHSVTDFTLSVPYEIYFGSREFWVAKEISMRRAIKTN
jgi:hypothetical protein